MAVKKGLGRGLDILIPKDNKRKDNIQESKNNSTNDNHEGKSVQKKGSDKTINEKDKVNEENVTKGNDQQILVDINKIEPNRNQPRKQFDEDSIEELADSIRQYGLIQPLVVQPKGDYYEIIAGERRWRASKEANLKKVPVIIKEYNDSDTLKISLIENLQRENLNPIEEAQAYQVLKKDYGLKQDEIASSVSKSRTAIANIMRLLKLDERIQNLIMEDQISYGHGRALLAIEDKEIQYKTALKIRDGNLSVREAERLVKKVIDQINKEKEEERVENQNNDNNFDMKVYEDKLKEIIGSKVVIKNNKNNKGKIEIDYFSKEEFERIIEFLQNL